jgi:hypothetical protein
MSKENSKKLKKNLDSSFDEKREELYRSIPNDAEIILNTYPDPNMMIDKVKLENYLINIKRQNLNQKKIHVIFCQDIELSELSIKIAKKNNINIHCLPKFTENPYELYFGYI